MPIAEQLDEDSPSELRTGFAERRVGRTPSFARARAPIAEARVNVAGSATGIDARIAVSTSGMTKITGILRNQA